MRSAKIVTALFALLLGSCSSGDSGPAATALKKQLVGHWSTPGEDNLYFGATEPSSETGTFIMVHPDGKEFTHRYKIESADAGKRTIKINLLFASGDSREEVLVVAKDGTSIDSTTTVTGVQVQSQLTRIDDRTAP